MIRRNYLQRMSKLQISLNILCVFSRINKKTLYLQSFARINYVIIRKSRIAYNSRRVQLSFKMKENEIGGEKQPLLPVETSELTPKGRSKKITTLLYIIFISVTLATTYILYPLKNVIIHVFNNLDIASFLL